MAVGAREVAAASTEIVTATAPRGMPYIATRAEAAIGGVVALEMLSEMHQYVDAAVIAASGDPGLDGARELFPIPLIGLAEAGMLTACMLGRSFAIVTFVQALEPWYRQCVAWHGLLSRCAGIRKLEGGFRSIQNVQEKKEALLVDLVGCAVREDGADVVILAGAPLADLAGKVRERIAVPVDCVAAAVKQLQSLIALRPRKAAASIFAARTSKPTQELAPALAAWIYHS